MEEFFGIPRINAGQGKVLLNTILIQILGWILGFIPFFIQWMSSFRDTMGMTISTRFCSLEHLCLRSLFEDVRCSYKTEGAVYAGTKLTRDLTTVFSSFISKTQTGYFGRATATDLVKTALAYIVQLHCDFYNATDTSIQWAVDERPEIEDEFALTDNEAWIMLSIAQGAYKETTRGSAILRFMSIFFVSPVKFLDMYQDDQHVAVHGFALLKLIENFPNAFDGDETDVIAHLFVDFVSEDYDFASLPYETLLENPEDLVPLNFMDLLLFGLNWTFYSLILALSLFGVLHGD